MGAVRRNLSEIKMAILKDGGETEPSNDVMLPTFLDKYCKILLKQVLRLPKKKSSKKLSVEMKGIILIIARKKIVPTMFGCLMGKCHVIA
jgi:hypothetical protein